MFRSKMRLAVSCFLIISTIVFIQFAIYSKPGDATFTGSAPDLQIRVTGKYIVGIRELIGQNPALQKRISQMNQNAQKNHGNRKQLSSIPIIAELSGKETALLELKKMSDNPEMVSDAGNLPIFIQIYHKGSASLDPGQQEALKRYGWIGKLALSQDKEDSDPERQAVLQSASRMAVLTGMLTMVILATFAGGLILLIIAIVLVVKGRLKSRLAMPENTVNSLPESFAIYLVGWGAIPTLAVMIAPDFRIGAIMLGVLAVLFSVLWPRFQGTEWKDFRTALGWNSGKGFFREVGAGIVGFITGLPLIAMGLIIAVILIQRTGASPSHPIVNMLGRSPIYLFLLACVWAPVTEETLFRGALFGFLRGYFSWVTSGIITGLIFAILHPQGWIAIPVLTIVGFNLSTIREWRGSIIASMTAHALHNGTAVFMLILAL